jgi:hypothetical protein
MAPPRIATDPRSQQIRAFGTVIFTGCRAATQNGQSVTPSSGGTFDMFYVNNPGTTLCQTTLPGSDQLSVNYEG